MKRILLVAMLAGACGGGPGTDIEASIRFEDRTDLEIARLINAASGTDLFQAQGQVLSFSAPDVGPCPALSLDGDTVSICRSTATQIEGTARASVCTQQ